MVPWDARNQGGIELVPGKHMLFIHLVGVGLAILAVVSLLFFVNVHHDPVGQLPLSGDVK